MKRLIWGVPQLEISSPRYGWTSQFAAAERAEFDLNGSLGKRDMPVLPVFDNETSAYLRLCCPDQAKSGLGGVHKLFQLWAAVGHRPLFAFRRLSDDPQG